jgi:hypothetical protein
MGWMTVLKLVPWTEVIKNAPVVADGAKRLWDSVGRKPSATPDGERGPDAAQRALEYDAPLAAVLKARLDDADAAIATLHEQMQASSTLIKALADQNTELVARVELNRRRVIGLGAAVAVLAVVVVVGVVLPLVR